MRDKFLRQKRSSKFFAKSRSGEEKFRAFFTGKEFDLRQKCERKNDKKFKRQFRQKSDKGKKD